MYPLSNAYLTFWSKLILAEKIEKKNFFQNFSKKGPFWPKMVKKRKKKKFFSEVSRWVWKPLWWGKYQEQSYLCVRTIKVPNLGLFGILLKKWIFFDPKNPLFWAFFEQKKKFFQKKIFFDQNFFFFSGAENII